MSTGEVIGCVIGFVLGVLISLEVIKPIYYSAVKKDCSLARYGVNCYRAGYNKANEWHFVKDGDLPKKELEEKQLLVRVRNYTEDCIFAYYMLDKYYSKNGKRFYSDIDCDYPIDTEDIIAWKEIVLPKESE